MSDTYTLANQAMKEKGTADAAGIQKVIEELGFEYKGRA